MTTESVNQNSAGAEADIGTDSAGTDTSTLFDTSQADAILSGAGPDDASNIVQPAQTEQQAPTGQLTPEQIESLRAQLAETPATTEETPSTDGPQFSEAFTSVNAKFKELSGMDFGTAIDEYMQAAVGMPLKDAISIVQGTQQYINHRQVADNVAQAQQTLQAEWGANYNTNFALAKQAFAKLEDGPLKDSLDNAQGAKILLSYALNPRPGVARTSGNVGAMNVATAPQNNVTVGNRPTLRHSEILAMNPKDYRTLGEPALISGNFIRDITQ